MPPSIRLLALSGIPEIKQGDDLARLVHDAVGRQHETLTPRSAIVVAQKVVSKAEGRTAKLSEVTPSPLAVSFARDGGKDPRLIEVVLGQARRVVKMDRGVLIVETHHGFICANGGVDQSNVPGDDTVTLLPLDPDESAARLRSGLCALSGVECAVVISDTFGRPWREGLVNVAIGTAGFRPLDDLRGTPDREGRPLRATVVALADELAAAAGLVMSKAAGVPAVLALGASWEPGSGTARDLLRPPETDLFR